MTFEIYLDPCTVNCRKVLAGLDLLGTQYHLNHIDYFSGGQKAPEFTKINPNATVPAATDGDLTIFESNAILQYAADKDGGHAAYPKDLKVRTAVNQWLLWEASAWFPSCYKYLVENVVKPLLKSEPDQSVIDGEAPQFEKLARVLDLQLAKTKYLTGNEVSIADIAVASPMHLHAAQRLPLDKYPNLKRWISQDIESLPSWQKTQGAVDKALLPGKSATPSTNGVSSHGHVRATVNYTKEVDKPTALYLYEPEGGAEDVHEPGDDAQEIAIYDGWHKAHEFTADKEGFSFHEFKTGYSDSDWENEEKVRADFYPEIVDFVKKQTGANRVLVFDHTIRTKGNDQKKLTQETNTSQRAPLMLVHCDYTAESGPIRVKQLLGDEADDLLKRRVAFFNVWKPIKNRVEERPLAMIDAGSAPASDFFKLHLHYRDREGENYVLRHSDKHKWWYFPGMTTEQVILLKTYESANDGRARFLGHSAFEDPTSPPDAAIRESLEVRTIAFF